MALLVGKELIDLDGVMTLLVGKWLIDLDGVMTLLVGKWLIDLDECYGIVIQVGIYSAEYWFKGNKQPY